VLCVADVVAGVGVSEGAMVGVSLLFSSSDVVSDVTVGVGYVGYSPPVVPALPLQLPPRGTFEEVFGVGDGVISTRNGVGVGLGAGVGVGSTATYCIVSWYASDSRPAPFLYYTYTFFSP
jgi:hypothetical protein